MSTCCENKFAAKNCKIISRREIGKDVFDLTIFYPELANWAAPGQFAHIYIPGHTLRRPISICDIDKARGTLRIVFQIRGEGTAVLAECAEQTFINVLAPLGKGFTLKDNKKKAVFVGGGIGVPPLLAAAKFYGKNAVVAMGFRDKENVILEEDFKNAGCDVRVATDDGSYGYHGFATQLIANEMPDVIYACGPMPMLKAVCAIAKEKNIDCEISLEERMACGVGACLGCACSLLDDNGNSYMGHVCKDGPVFNYKLVDLS